MKGEVWTITQLSHWLGGITAASYDSSHSWHKIEKHAFRLRIRGNEATKFWRWYNYIIIYICIHIILDWFKLLTIFTQIYCWTYLPKIVPSNTMEAHLPGCDRRWGLGSLGFPSALGAKMVVSWNGGTPIAGCFRMENSNKIDDLGVPFTFRKPPKRFFTKNMNFKEKLGSDESCLTWIGLLTYTIFLQSSHLFLLLWTHKDMVKSHSMLAKAAIKNIQVLPISHHKSTYN